MGRDLPVVVHVTSYAFAPGSHPGVYRTVLGLAGRACNVVLCADHAAYADDVLSEPAREALAARGVHVHTLAFRRLKKAPLVGHLAAGIRRRYGRVDALVGHLGNNGWRAIPLGARAGAPILTIFHGQDATVDLRSARYGWRYRRLLRAPGTHVAGVAQHLTERVVGAGADPARAATHHLGLALDGIRPVPAATRRGALRVALVGRLIPVKGHATALRAFAQLRSVHPASELHLFGAGPCEDELRALAAAFGLGEAVRFRGVLPVGELLAELARLDAAIQPSERDASGLVEGVPNSLLEAMALGLPVVATRHGGIPEAVLDGETGLLVAVGDADALAKALLELARDPERRGHLGRAGRAHVEREFEQGRQGERLLARLEAMADGYRQLPRRARRRAWGEALDGLLDPTGRRARLEGLLATQLNRLRGRIP